MFFYMGDELVEKGASRRGRVDLDSYIVHTTRFWNNLPQVHSVPNLDEEMPYAISLAPIPHPHN